MGEIVMQSTGLCTVSPPAPVGGVDYNPYLKTPTGSPVDVVRAVPPGFPAAYLTGGPATVSNARYNALVGRAGSRRELQMAVEINGTDYTRALAEPVPLGENSEDRYQVVQLQMLAPRFSYLTHQDANPGKTVNLFAALKDQDSGTKTRYPVFSGRIQSVETSVRSRRTMVRAESWDSILDRKKIHLTLRLQGVPYGCVLAGYYDEFQSYAQDNPTTILLGGGRGVLDVSSGGGGGSTKTVDIPGTTTLDLPNIPGLTLNGPNAPGMKSIYISQYQYVTAADASPPPGTVPLWTWEQRAENMIITQGDLLEAMYITLEKGRRRLSQVITYLLEREGIDVTVISFPPENDDELTSEMQFSGSFAQVVDNLARLARWRRTRTGDGKLAFVADWIPRHTPYVADWKYGPGEWTDLRISSPETSQVPGGGLVVVGNNTVNKGREMWLESSKAKVYGPKTRKSPPSGASLGGNYTTIGEGPGYGSQPLELKRTIDTDVWFLGGSEFKRSEQISDLKNPLNYKALANDPTARLSGSDAGSAESGIGHLFEEQKLIPSKQTLWEARFYAGIFLGFQKRVWIMDNPVSHTPGAIGSDPLDPTWFGGVGYGFKFAQDNWILLTDERVYITPSPWGFIAEQKNQFWGLGNPNVNYEVGGFGNPGNTVSIGKSFASEEALILMLEEITTFRRDDYEWTTITKDRREFKKKASSSAHGTIGFGGSTRGLGHQQGELVGQESERSRVRQQPPALTCAEERIEVTPVVCTLISPSVQADFGNDNQIVLAPPYLQSTDQACRYAHYEWEKRLAIPCVITARYNPAMRRWQKINLIARTPYPDSRVLDVTGIVTGYRALPPHRGRGVSSMQIDMDIGYYDIKPFLDARF
jgi:hypothetical protein